MFIARSYFISAFALASTLLFPFGAAAQKGQDGDDFYGRKYALVIGNSKYETKPLTNPENDAADIAGVLGKTGFKVTTVLNADKAALQLALAKFESSLPKRAAVVVFYAGHAVQYQSQNVLLPVDAIGKIKRADDLFAHGLVMSDLLQPLVSRKDSVTTIILDACRDSPFPDKPEFSGGLSRSAGVSLAGREDGKARKGGVMEGVYIAYSTAPQMTAADGEGRNSPYTKHLKEFLKRPNTTLETILKLTRTEVTKETNGAQTPWYETSINGEFYPAGRGRAEFEDLLRRFVPIRSANYEDNAFPIIGWNRLADDGDPIAWQKDLPAKNKRGKQKQISSLFDNFPKRPYIERGEVRILLDGKETEAGKWDVWLLGVRGGYTEVYFSNDFLGFGGPDPAHGFGQSAVLEIVPACEKDDSINGTRVFKVNLPQHDPAWLAEAFTCGAALCQSEYLLIFSRQELKRYGCS